MHILVSFKIEIKIKIIMIHSRPNIYKYMILKDFHPPLMKEEQLRNNAELYLFSDHHILSYLAKFLLLDL